TPLGLKIAPDELSETILLRIGAVAFLAVTLHPQVRGLRGRPGPLRSPPGDARPGAGLAEPARPERDDRLPAAGAAAHLYLGSRPDWRIRRGTPQCAALRRDPGHHEIRHPR